MINFLISLYNVLYPALLAGLIFAGIATILMYIIAKYLVYDYKRLHPETEEENYD